MTSGTTNNLNDVWGSVSDNVVYAVGNGGTILRYRDGAWSSMESLTSVQLNAVWGSSGSAVYAVGAEGTIRWYDGSVPGTWTGMGGGTTVVLNDVWGSSATDIFFVGDAGTIGRFENGGWSSMSIGGGASPDLMALWGATPSDVFAVGEQGAIIRYLGSGSWTQMSSPSTNNLNGVWGSSSSNAYAVGDNAEDFVFLQSLTEWVDLQPNGEFHGSLAGSGTVELSSGSELMSPEDAGDVNFPRYRWMNIETYVIDQL
ncbi:MAG: hypothetical protein FJ020_08665 [Chloroflexi bacterium]|nr:hypothetical protein [Chloroflexota bacterium]